MEAMRSVTRPAAEDIGVIQKLTLELEEETGMRAVLDRKVAAEGGMVTLVWRVFQPNPELTGRDC